MPPEPVVAPPAGNPRYELIDALRGIAVLMVCVVHAGYLSGANLNAWYGDAVARLELALPIFFVISAFLLYRPFVAARLDGRPMPSVRRYAIARVTRIVPAYWLALTALTLFPGLPQLWGTHPWVYYGFLQVYEPSWAFGGILPAWSLCVEVTFYLMLPITAGLLRLRAFGVTRRQRVRAEVAVVGVLYAVGLAYRAALHGFGVPRTDSLAYLTLPAALEWLMLGMALAVVSASLTGRTPPAAIRAVGSRPGWCWTAAIALFAFATLGMGLTASSPHLGIHLASSETISQAQWLGLGTLYGVIPVLLLLPAVLEPEGGGWPRRVLANRALGFVGVISYGIFLWHLPIMAWLANGPPTDLWGHRRFLGIGSAGLALATVMATISYYALERPLMARAHRFTRTMAKSRAAA